MMAKDSVAVSHADAVGLATVLPSFSVIKLSMGMWSAGYRYFSSMVGWGVM